MNTIKYILLILTALIISCTEPIDLKLDSGYTRLVVYGEITTDTMAHRINLSYSADYLIDRSPVGVEGALVELSWADTSVVLSPVSPGIYATSPGFYGIPGTTYNLRISGVDINNDLVDESYEASAAMPFTSPLDSIKMKYTANSFFSGWEIMVYAWDPKGIRNFYSFKSFKNGILQTDTLTEYFVQSDDFFDGNFTYGITSQFLDDSKETEKAFPGDTVIFEMDGINEEFFWFILEAQGEAFGSNPLFSGPPANIRSNISNGALGFFTAYSLQRQTVIVPDYPVSQ